MRPSITCCPHRILLLHAFILLSKGVWPGSLCAQETPPTATDDFWATDSITSVTMTVLDNDIPGSAAIDPATVEIVQRPATGSAAVTPNGEIEFTPAPGAAVLDYLVYEVSDVEGRVSNPASVWIDVMHDPPAAYDDSAVTLYTQDVTIDVLGNDFQGTAPFHPVHPVEIVTEPAHGTVDVADVTGEVTYTPDDDYTGTDWFEYKVLDEYGVESPKARVGVDVVNMQPDITTFDAWPDAYGYWVFAGQVTDERPETCTIDFSGVITGTAYPDETGHFEVTVYIPPGTSGVATAIATDELGKVSSPANTFVFSS